MLPPRLDTYLCGGQQDLLEFDDGDGVEEDVLERWPMVESEHVPWWEGSYEDVEEEEDEQASGGRIFETNFGKDDGGSFFFHNGRNLKGGFYEEDNVPVALLAKRGECTYETKARVALKLKASYVIVYDDRVEHSLISMAASTEHVEDLDNIGLLFVSNKDGRDLLQTVYEQRTRLSTNQRVRVLLDGYSQWWPDYAGDPIGWVGLVFMVFMCISTLSLFMTTNFFRAGSAGIINIQQEGGAAASRRRQGPRLLTEDEVMTLPEVRYRGEVAMSTMRRSSDDGSLKLKTSDSFGDEDDVKNEEEPAPSADESTVSSDNQSQCEHYTDTCCTICLEDYEPGEKLRVLPCQHSFHSECIIPWLTTRSPTCPLCKTYFEATSEDEEDEGEVVNDENENNAEEGNEEGASQQNASYVEVEEETNATQDETQRREAATMTQQETESIWSTISGAGGGLRRIFHTGSGDRQDTNSSGLEEPLLPENQRSEEGNGTSDIV